MNAAPSAPSSGLARETGPVAACASRRGREGPLARIFHGVPALGRDGAGVVIWV